MRNCKRTIWYYTLRDQCLPNIKKFYVVMVQPNYLKNIYKKNLKSNNELKILELLIYSLISKLFIY